MVSKPVASRWLTLISTCLIALVANAANAEIHSQSFKVTENDVANYGEESVQLDTEQGYVSIYAINLSNEILDVLLAAKAGNCITIESKTPITRDGKLYSIDQISSVSIHPCPIVPAETISTGCLLENNKALVVSDLNANPTYSYGKPGHPEMVLSASDKHNVFKGTQMFSGGGATYVRFINGDISYVVYSSLGKGWSFDGVLVYKEDKQIFHSQCQEVDQLLYGIHLDDIDAPYDEGSLFIGPPS